MQATATGSSAGILSLAWSRIQSGALGLIAPIKSAALAFWGMLPAIGATTAALLANPITWIVAGIGVAVAGLALVIRKYWDPIAAYVGGVFQGIGSALQPAITSLSTALAPLAPIGQAVASVFGFIADAASGLVGWVGELLAPVTLSKDEFDSLSASGQSLGTVIGSVLSTAFTALTFPIRAVGNLVGWVMEGFRWLVSFSPLAALQAAWQPLSGFFGSLWTGVVSGARSAWQQLTAALGSFAPLHALQSVIGSMLTALRDLPSQFMSLGSAMLQGLAQGVRNAAQQAVAAVGEVAAGVRDRFKAMLGIHSPSRVFATLGSALSLGLAQGVAAAGPAVVSEVGQLAQSLQAVPLSLATPEVVLPEPGAPTVPSPSLGAAVLPPVVMPRLAPSFASSAPEPEPAAPVDQPGLRLPSPDRPSLGLALPARIDVPVPTLRPVWEEMPAREVPPVRDESDDGVAPARAQSVSMSDPTRVLLSPQITVSAPLIEIPAPQIGVQLPAVNLPAPGSRASSAVTPPAAPSPQITVSAPSIKMPSPQVGGLLPAIHLPTLGERLPPSAVTQPVAPVSVLPSPVTVVVPRAGDTLPSWGKPLAPDAPPRPESEGRLSTAGAVPAPEVPKAPLAPSAPATSGAPTIHFAPQITIHAPPGSDPQALADLLEGRLRSLIRDALRGSSAALHD